MPASTRSLFDKIWDAHEVAEGILYVDLHLVHEGHLAAGVRVASAGGTSGAPAGPALATADHNVPTDGSTAAHQIEDQLSRVRSRPSNATPRSSACRSTRSAPPVRASCT